MNFNIKLNLVSIWKETCKKNRIKLNKNNKYILKCKTFQV